MATAYDAVIIGAGPSGLAAAVRLSHFGLAVCLVEAHSRPGGLNSWHHVRGREISSGLHAFTNYREDGKGPLGKLLRQLRLKFSDLGLHPQGFSSIRFPSAVLRFDNRPEFLREQVRLAFPADADAFDRLRRKILDTDEGAPASLQTSARDVVESFIANPLLVDMLFCPVMFYGNPGGVGDGLDGGRRRPDMDWLLFCVVWKCIFETGLACPAGGMRPLWETLAGRFRENGGELLLSARVESLAAGDGRVSGVRLADGREIAGRTVFSSAGRIETLRLLGRSGGGEDERQGISVAEGVSLLDRPAAEAGLGDTVVFYSFEDGLSFGRPDGLVENRNGVVCAMGNYRLPDDGKRHVLKVAQLANHRAWRELGPHEYRAAKREAGRGMEEALRKLGIALDRSKPGEGEFGRFDDLFTPLTLERFTGHAGGALYGSPVKSRTGATGFANLFLIGADQGFHGIVGAMLSGVAMANAHALGKS